MSNIAIIPARSGSKGLKDKNIKPLHGKPLLAYSIAAALESRIFDEVMVSTDSENYARVAREYGAQVPFLRSEELSTDSAGSWDVVREVLKKYAENGQRFDMVTLLQPTSPLRAAKDILGAYSLYKEKQAKAVVSVCEMEHSPLWSNILPEDGSLEGFLRPEVINCGGRQNLDTYYRINGAIYMYCLKDGDMSFDLYAKGCYAYRMERETSVDIDVELDFVLTEFLLSRRNQK